MANIRVKHLNHINLKEACFKFAKNTMWELKPIDVARIQNFAEQIYQEALFYEEYLINRKRDPNILVLCLKYLEHKHGYPIADDIKFLKSALEILIELICPNTDTDSSLEPFFSELLIGIDEALNLVEES